MTGSDICEGGSFNLRLNLGPSPVLITSFCGKRYCGERILAGLKFCGGWRFEAGCDGGCPGMIARFDENRYCGDTELT